MSFSIDEERLRKIFEKYSSIGSTDAGGLDRVALSAADKEARDQFIEDAEELGLKTRIDRVGNIFARREGANSSLKPVIIGSHLDSQPKGGRYDGQLGIICAFETVRALDDHNITPDRPIEIVNWTNEEGTRFNLAPLGSGTFAGVFSEDEALSAVDENMISVEQALEEIGYNGDTPCESYPIHAYLELHIEQSTTLERTDNQVGIVSGVVGIDWLRVSITGVADHAGTTSIHARKDPMVTASTVVSNLKSLPSYLSEDVVVTVGKLHTQPGSINVIPEEIVFTVDIRCNEDRIRNEAIDYLERELEAATSREGTTYDIERLMRSDSKEFSHSIRQSVREACELTGSHTQEMVSWATHDAMYVQKIGDAGMIFVPSVDGQSHSENEFTEWSDVVTGANVYANAVRSLATVQ
jgi:N-carbamoyl-L-amino-acid hydrolase